MGSPSLEVKAKDTEPVEEIKIQPVETIKETPKLQTLAPKVVTVQEMTEEKPVQDVSAILDDVLFQNPIINPAKKKKTVNFAASSNPSESPWNDVEEKKVENEEEMKIEKGSSSSSSSQTFGHSSSSKQSQSEKKMEDEEDEVLKMLNAPVPMIKHSETQLKEILSLARKATTVEDQKMKNEIKSLSSYETAPF